ncbi:PREDICTED: lysM domain receptor-like kinase 3 isoform X2 [Nicotiana attenuata]|uniref:lysM domain receptor-like kinase 3 isoform X2 n=1 Tax=Nicotiana attenuata TaxID=49451 RepID=UPI000904A470|nr:PREDICTED: lysM domain receptor-like kinase 3 isoform X2 [Nicotiana attenuata]
MQIKPGICLFLRIRIILFVIYYIFSVHYYVVVADSTCREGCALAFASYSLHRGYYDEFVSDVSRRLFPDVSVPEILSYNPSFVIPLTQAEADIIIKIKIPFRCDCLNNGDYLGHVFPYNLRSGDTYGSVAAEYSGLVTEEWLMRVNSYPYNNIPVNNVTLNVTVNCSCGNKEVSEDYGLFITYPIRPGETLESIALATGTSSELIQMYNPAVNFSAGTRLLYIPGRGSSGKFIAGMAVASLAGVTLLIGIIYVGIYRKKAQKVVPHISAFADQSHPSGQGLLGIAVEKSVEFSYKELAESTNGFSISNKIGEGGFGAIYYAELRDKITAIKQMKRQAKTEFLTELQILTRVHHLNLVCLIGYCVERYLFLVYEYIDNGNLSQHLRGRDTLPWSTRVQIALDSARGLEYIHEHSVPVCIHRDIKSANILINKNFHAKVGDFGLTKLVENGNSTLPTRFMGTFGYMAPEYGRSGIISPKVDVYAFGVVLYELISSKEAVVKEDGVDDARSLVALFEEAHNHPNPIEGISRLIDPKLGDNYPFDSVHKMAQLAKACTEKDHQMRPTMRSVVVALMACSSSTED